ncbi:alanine/glycine:cation symporter family protein [Devriesea agamarum]|uniref:alanine/glycine:cation symporter family protein n=1 Tax=Devriesea agamarum TaxID=472569 RepID=UPI00071E0A77|nr:alanine/glycine:cation symporter family protein [Devriesea agamarum]
MPDFITPVIEWIIDTGSVMWTFVVLPVVVIIGLYFTVRSGVVQARLIPAMLTSLGDKALPDAAGRKTISAFQAFTVSAASRVGVGNIAGVGTAIATGGAGAVFWMWVMAFIGGASSFVESTLGQLYKVRDRDGSYRGGPAYYMRQGLKAPWLGIIFAIVLIVCFPFAFSMLQANTIVATIGGALPEGEASRPLAFGIGIVLALLTGLVVFGGIRRIVHWTETIVPVMALIYLLAGIVVVAVNIEHVPDMFVRIIESAFGLREATGGFAGWFTSVLLTGVKRGMFSNEAGLGSAPNAGATAAVSHPVKQGLVQTLGVYFDTFLVCSITAFIILVSQDAIAADAGGVQLTQSALVEALGPWSAYLLILIIFLLAFSSILGNYYYGESNVFFISTSPKVMFVFRCCAVIAILVGAMLSVSVVWDLADAVMGVMALLNLVSIALLSGIAMRLLKDYTSQKRAGREPVFLSSTMPDLQGIECWEKADVGLSDDGSTSRQTSQPVTKG